MQAEISSDDLKNKKIYENPDTAKFYAEHEDLLPGEDEAYARYVTRDLRVLDLGIGGGRTTVNLTKVTKNYVGIDYSSAMIDACRKKFPGLDLRVMDASNLSEFKDGTFDVVIFSFNGIDYLHPYEKRTRCLEECRRVLKDGGVLIFSTHNAKWLGFLPQLDVQGLPKKLWRAAYASYRSARLATRMPLQEAFWTGHGYVLDKVHGGLVTFHAVPEFIGTELRKAGLTLERTIAGTRYARNIPYVQPWYHYVARKGR